MPDTLGNTVLMNMIFAIGALDCGTSSSSATGENYYRAARKALQRGMLDGGSMALVQGVAIMSNYLQRSGKSNAGYMCLGWASRMAMSLGLHLGPGPDGSALDGEMRLRVWWCVVTLEAGCAVTFGRPHPAGAYQLEAAVLPVNCDDEHLTVSSTMRPQSQPYVTLYSPLVYQSRLARVTCAILDRVLHSHSALTVAQLRQYDARVSHVVDATPAAFFDLSYGRFQLSRAIQKWRTKDFRAMLYRPLLLGAAWGSRGRQVSEEVVEAIK
jgi:transcriptional regulatory protein GAL4